MASIEEALYSILTGASALTALVGTRIGPAGFFQEPTGSYVTYQLISGPVVHTMGADPGLASPRFQVTAWALGRNYAGAKAIAAQIRAALRDYSGIAAGVTVQRAFLENEVDLGYDGLATGVAQDYTIWHE